MAKLTASIRAVDADLHALLVDVLPELGVEVVAFPARGDAVLVEISRQERPLDVLAEARRFLPGAPVIALLPFADLALVQEVRKAGAEDFFALGAPLHQLVALVRGLTVGRRLQSEGSPR